MITETDKVPVFDRHRHGETYIKEVRYLAPTVGRKHMAGADHRLAERRRAILGVFYQCFPRRVSCCGPARTLTKEGYEFCSEAGCLTDSSLPAFEVSTNGSKGYSIYPLQFINISRCLRTLRDIWGKKVEAYTGSKLRLPILGPGDRLANVWKRQEMEMFQVVYREELENFLCLIYQAKMDEEMMKQSGSEGHQYSREKTQLFFNIDDQFVTKSRPHSRKPSIASGPPSIETTRSLVHHHSNPHILETSQHQSPTERYVVEQRSIALAESQVDTFSPRRELPISSPMGTPIPTPIPASSAVHAPTNLISGSRRLSGLVGAQEFGRGANASSTPQAPVRQSGPNMALHVPRAIQAMNNREHQWYRDPESGNTIRMPRIRENPGLSAIQENIEAEENQGHRSRLGGFPFTQSQKFGGPEYIGTNHQQSRRVSGGRPVEGDFPEEESSGRGSSKENGPNGDTSDRRLPNRRSGGGGFSGKGGPGGNGLPGGGPGGGPYGGDPSNPDDPHSHHRRQEPDLPKGQRDIHRSMSNSTDYTGVRQVGDYHFDRKLKPEIVPTWNGNPDTLAGWLLEVNDFSERGATLYTGLGSIVPKRQGNQCLLDEHLLVKQTEIKSQQSILQGEWTYTGTAF